MSHLSVTQAVTHPLATAVRHADLTPSRSTPENPSRTPSRPSRTPAVTFTPPSIRGVTVAPTAAPGAVHRRPPRTQQHPALLAVPPRSTGSTPGVGT